MSDDESNRETRPLYQRLPKLNTTTVKKTTGLKPEVSINNKANRGTKTNGQSTRRNNKYANVSSSGYGRSSYKPVASLKVTHLLHRR